jgi:hypothetical protein
VVRNKLLLLISFDNRNIFTFIKTTNMKKLIIFSTIAVTVLTLMQCKKQAEGEDKVLFEKSNSTSGFVYYKNTDEILNSSQPSAHNKYFRTRFNSIASAALTDNGKLPIGTNFPEGSLVVKELFDSKTGSLKLIAVMEKLSGNSAAANGWLWAEYTPDGKVVVSLDEKGKSCVSCHSTNARDYVRLFELFP